MGKIILITGGSEGIGAATARLAAKRGYVVCINYLMNHAAATGVVNEIQQNGGTAFAFAADVSKETEVEALFKKIDQQVGSITALVNNAGIVMAKQRVEEMTAERISQVFAVNVIGSFLCCREAIKRMSLKNGGAGGAIVNVSSAASRHGSPGEYVDYAATKGAIDTLTIGLSKELADQAIRVNAVRPGIIDTAIHAKAGDPERARRLASSIPMKREGKPDEVSHTILWLLSEEASYITGALLDVSGGR
jgi:NAD(P)-dependent dehydrogenase (short-subunit alcohol dehydrogenase family)